MVAGGALLLVLVLLLGSARAATGPPVARDTGTVNTLVLPVACDGSATPDESSAQVRGIAVDASGTLHVETGRPGKGLIGRVEPTGNAYLTHIGVPDDADNSPAADAPHDVGPASRVASDGTGGAFVTAGTAIVRLHATAGAAVVAGAPGVAAPRGGHGDEGPAEDARFRRLGGLASDEDGNLYVVEELDADRSAVVVRFFNRSDEPVTFYPGTPHQLTVSPDAIATIAGGQESNGGAAARDATLAGLAPSVAVAGARLYIALYGPAGRARPDAEIKVINLGGGEDTIHGVQVPPGGIATIAGGGPTGYGGDGGPALRAGLGYLPGMAADPDGNLFVADTAHHRIRRIDVDGTITTYAGTGGIGPDDGGFNGNNRHATEATLNHPHDVALGPDRRLYVSDRRNAQVRYVDEDNIIRATAGNGVSRRWRCAAEDEASEPGSDTAAPPLPAGVEGVILNGPSSVAADARGRVYFAVPSHGQVSALDPTGDTATAVISASAQGCPAGEQNCQGEESGGIRGPRHPVGLAVRPQGGLYVLDGDTAEVWLLNPGTDPFEAHGLTVPARAARPLVAADAASDDERPVSPPGGGDDTSFFGGGPLAADTNSNLFWADPGAGIRQVDSGGKETRIAGAGQMTPDGPCCWQPAAVALDRQGNLYIADTGNLRVWAMNRGSETRTILGRTIAAGAIEPVAGDGTQGFGGDGGPALDAQFQRPVSVAVDEAGDLYVADLGEHVVRKVDASGTITTAVGVGSRGFNGDGLAAGVTALSLPTDLAFDHCGNLLVADKGNNRVRRVNIVEPCEASASQAEATVAVPSGDNASPAPGIPLPLLLGLAVVALTVGALLAITQKRRRRRDGATTPAMLPAGRQDGPPA